MVFFVNYIAQEVLEILDFILEREQEKTTNNPMNQAKGKANNNSCVNMNEGRTKSALN